MCTEDVNKEACFLGVGSVIILRVLEQINTQETRALPFLVSWIFSGRRA